MKPLTNVAASVHQKLLNRSRETKRPFNELAQYYALERWLFRLSRSEYRDQFVLKGALMLLVWEVPASRPTRDIDLLGRLSKDLRFIHDVIASICQGDGENDGISYDPDSISTERIAEDANYEGVRATFTGNLGKIRLPMQIDIGFSDVMTPGPDAVVYPVMLGNAAPELNAYNRETAIAEKFEAMVKLGEVNSRMKDFFDIWILARTGEFQGERLAQAIERTFRRRGTVVEMEPVCFTETFSTSASKAAQWSAFLRRSQFSENPDSLADVVSAISNFLCPIASGIVERQQMRAIWRPGGPWVERPDAGVC